MNASRYLELFISESREHLAAIDDEIARLAAAPHEEGTLHELFRHAHSIKGMAATMGYPAVADVAHTLEDLLDRVRRGVRAFDPPLQQEISAGFDRIEGMIAAIAEETNRSPGSEPAVQAPAADDAPPLQLIRLLIDIDPSSAMPAARALVVVKRMEARGRIVRCAPSPERIAARQFEGRLDLLIEISGDGEALATEARRLTDVASVDLTVVRGAPQPEAPDTPDDAASLPPPSPKSTEGGVAPLAASSVRVPARSLDRFLDTIGELIVQRGRLAGHLRTTGDHAAQRELDRVKALVDRLYGDVMALRMLPFDTIVHRFTRSVREVSTRVGKRVALKITGRDVLLDRSILDELIDPVNHLLRNAIDHGLESPEERRAAGKPESGTITLSLVRAGDSVTLTIEDDGRGMDADRIRQTAIRKGFLTPEQAAALGPADSLMLTTIPGFSTADRITDLSGRGVGMDVVRTRVETLGGRLRLRSRRGSGLSVAMRLPLTIVVVNAFIVEAAGRQFAVPLTSIRRTIAVPRTARLIKDGREHVEVDGDLVPLHDLAMTLGLPEGPSGRAQGIEALLASERDRSVALLVDRITGRREIVVKPLRSPLEELRGFSGAAILEDGAIALILDPLSLPLA